MKKRNVATGYALLAAALYAINIPLSKLFLSHVTPGIMAGILYLGAGIGMFFVTTAKTSIGKDQNSALLTKQDLPYTIGMVVLDIIAPILLMIGISMTPSANVSLLNNFEIVATSLIALLIFKEAISKRLWTAIVIVTIASILLSFEGRNSFSFHAGSLFVLGASICWGLENNCTKMISNKSANEIVIIKGIFSGSGSLILAFLLGEHFPPVIYLLPALLLGFVAYGLSINFYIMAQKDLGAAKTSAYYSISPFLGVIFSMLLLQEHPSLRFYIALILMILATILMTKDTIALQHTHEHTHTHTHPHCHGNLTHTHEHTHTHTHMHVHKETSSEHMHTVDELTDHKHIHSPE